MKASTFLLTLFILGLSLSADEINEALANGTSWLKAHQNDNGSWSSTKFRSRCPIDAPPCTGSGDDWVDPGLTALGLLALLESGGFQSPHPQEGSIQRAANYLISIQASDGLYGQAVGKFMYNQLIATTAMCYAAALFAEEKSFQASAVNAIQYILKAQSPGGSWRYKPKSTKTDTVASGWALKALWSARAIGISIPSQAFIGPLTWLMKTTDRQKTGRTGYLTAGDPGAMPREYADTYAFNETCTAISLASLLESGFSKSNDLVERQVDLLLDTPPTVLPDKRGKHSVNYYYWYLGSKALSLHGGGPWLRWRKALEPTLLGHQIKGDSHERGSWPPDGLWCLQGGRAYATAMAVLTLSLLKPVTGPKIETPNATDAQIQVAISRALLSGKIKTARSLLRALFQRASSRETSDPMDAELAFLYGETMCRSGLMKRAKGKFSNILQIDPTATRQFDESQLLLLTYSFWQGKSNDAWHLAQKMARDARLPEDRAIGSYISVLVEYEKYRNKLKQSKHAKPSTKKLRQMAEQHLRDFGKTPWAGPIQKLLQGLKNSN